MANTTQTHPPTAQLAPLTLADAGATAAAMLHSVDPVALERIYRDHIKGRDDAFAFGFTSYRMRQHEGGSR